jgi:uncharacterized protein (DUF433 family)
MTKIVKQLIGESPASQTVPDIAWVTERGTMDPFYALYIGGKLTVTNPRSDVANVLNALGLKQRHLYVAKGFDGNFPEQLADLQTFEKP